MIGRDHYLPGYRCPWCSHENDGASGIETDDLPSPGDVGVCVACAQPTIYETSGLRRATKADFDSFTAAERTQVEQAMRTVRRLNRRT